VEQANTYGIYATIAGYFFNNQPLFLIVLIVPSPFRTSVDI